MKPRILSIGNGRFGSVIANKTSELIGGTPFKVDYPDPLPSLGGYTHILVNTPPGRLDLLKHLVKNSIARIRIEKPAALTQTELDYIHSNLHRFTISAVALHYLPHLKPNTSGWGDTTFTRPSTTRHGLPPQYDQGIHAYTQAAALGLKLNQTNVAYTTTNHRRISNPFEVLLDEADHPNLDPLRIDLDHFINHPDKAAQNTRHALTANQYILENPCN